MMIAILQLRAQCIVHDRTNACLLTQVPVTITLPYITIFAQIYYHINCIVASNTNSNAYPTRHLLYTNLINDRERFLVFIKYKLNQSRYFSNPSRNPTYGKHSSNHLDNKNWSKRLKPIHLLNCILLLMLILILLYHLNRGCQLVMHPRVKYQ